VQCIVPKEVDMRSALAAALIAAAMAASPFSWAAGGDKGEQEIPLKDGTKLVIFKDGKMAMRDARGRPLGMKENHPMETKDGKIIMMRGNELWRKTQGEKELEDLYRGGN
jgi:hypothetical protein